MLKILFFIIIIYLGYRIFIASSALNRGKKDDYLDYEEMDEEDDDIVR